MLPGDRCTHSEESVHNPHIVIHFLTAAGGPASRILLVRQGVPVLTVVTSSFSVCDQCVSQVPGQMHGERAQHTIPGSLECVLVINASENWLFLNYTSCSWGGVQQLLSRLYPLLLKRQWSKPKMKQHQRHLFCPSTILIITEHSPGHITVSTAIAANRTESKIRISIHTPMNT